MSGIEVAGLVLGAFPILLEALDRWHEGGKVLQTWWRFEKAYKGFRREIKYQETAFNVSIKKFLLPLLLTQDERERLLADPNGKLWREPQLEERLRNRMPAERYELFLETMYALQQAMEELKRKLGVSNHRFQSRLSSETQGVPTDNPLVIEAFWSLVYEAQRMKISLGETTRNELIQQVDKLNIQLHKILKASDEIVIAETLVAARKKSPLPRTMLSFWSHADKVYTLLKTAWHCNCISMHAAYLLLEDRTYQKIDFRIAFNYGNDVLEPATPTWQWHDTVVLMVEKKPFPSLATTAIEPPSVPPPVASERSLLRRIWGKHKSAKVVPVRYVEFSRIQETPQTDVQNDCLSTSDRVF